MASEHAQLPSATNHHTPHVQGAASNSGSHRFHPYPRPEQPAGVTGKNEVQRDVSRDPRLRARAAANGHVNGSGLTNGNTSRKDNLSAGNGSSGTVADLSVRNIINSSRDPRQRNR